MSGRPPRFSQADIIRAMKAAEKAGNGWEVEVDRDGTIRFVKRDADDDARNPQAPGTGLEREPMVLF